MQVGRVNVNYKSSLLAILVLFFGFCVYAYYFLFTWKEVEIHKGYSKAAIKNDFLAAQTYLDHLSIENAYTLTFPLLDRLVTEQALRERDTLVLINARNVIKGQRFDHLWQWVETGGTLITSINNL